MIRLGLRLAIAGGKEVLGRLALIVLAVAVGVGLLLSTLGAINAFRAQNERYAWLETGFVDEGPAPASTATAGRVDSLWWRLRADAFRGERIGRVDLAATGPRSPVPPGIPALPGPGEAYASPALAELLRDAPSAQLGARFPATLVGTIGPEALPAPDSLLIVVGHRAADLAHQPDVDQVFRISTTSPSDCSGACAPIGTDAEGMTLVLSVVAAGLLFPVLVFIGGATRLSAARREQRFAAMRLVGATPRQVSGLAAVESSVATAIGLVLGFAAFYALRPLVATIPFSGERSFTSDLSLTGRDVALVAVGVPVAAAVAARLALRRVHVSPLGVVRRSAPRSPRAWRVVPVLAGLAWLAYLAYASDIADTQAPGTQALAYLAGVFATMAGLVVAGPWLTAAGARLLVHRAGRPAGLIAARRLADDPQAAFRAISGVVLAVFVGTCAIGIMATIVASNGGADGDPSAARGTLVHTLAQGRPTDAPAAPLSRGDRDRLTSIDGVEGVLSIHIDAAVPPGEDPRTYAGFFATCAELARTPALGRCPAGAAVAKVDPHFGGAVIDPGTSMAATTWPAADRTPAQVEALPVHAVVVGTDGSTAAVERARTVLEALHPSASLLPETLSEIRAESSRTLDRYQQLANVVVLTSLPIAGCSLAVSVAGSLADRRRPFGLLRLAGTPLALLRRVVALEAVVPLLAGVVVSAAVGLLAAALFLRAQLDQTLQPPTVAYYLLVAGGVVTSLAIVASTFPLLARTTGPEANRDP